MLSRLLINKHRLLTICVCGWVAIVAVGVWALKSYANTPGRPAAIDSDWPAGISLIRGENRATLVMAIHPLCPCSRASMNELEGLMARCSEQVSAIVLFVDYPEITSDLSNNDLWQMASHIPAVKCVRDEGAKLSTAFGAQTSGQVFLYDADGILRFSGGITVARGHAGDNDGLRCIESILNRVAPTTRSTAVYGCSLR